MRLAEKQREAVELGVKIYCDLVMATITDTNHVDLSLVEKSQFRWLMATFTDTRADELSQVDHI